MAIVSAMIAGTPVYCSMAASTAPRSLSASC
jgi:hypothetical protein